ncbi:polysaccharide biosynthesis/export family protein [Ruegeria sp. 2012CJ41-6]|uniref:Polysaccharide biosynthesis/export family protein n=1 Tax=Ruegeria spongiae TaxID=2942209 RepID=A0ABT0Q6Y4_9RHOB|nr:polysaccharide biosynthesis/export family protein [Ruegeria spongiae]MCL6285638.1 polysaccharide biosynthesis/export family protein [Ruegeria spongiae]
MTETFHAPRRISIATCAVQLDLRHFLRLPGLLPVIALWIFLAQSAWSQQVGSGTAYELGATDQIEVRIVAWDSNQQAFVQFDELSGAFRIGQDGNVMLPLVGAIAAAGRAPVELAENISEAVHRKVGLNQPPSTTVEVLQYRPIYVLGDVMRQGAYDYRPGLTAVQAVALAGGLYRLGSSDAGDLINAIRTSGTFRELGMDRARMQLRAARLRAEADGLEDFDAPAGLRSPGGETAVAAMLEQERTLFASRRDTLVNALEELAASRKLLETEIAAREEKLAGLKRQVELVKESVGNMETLVERGLSRSQNLILVQQTLIDLEARALDTETGIFRAQQEISELNRDEADLISARRLETLRELQNTEAELDRLATREAVNRRILRETEVGAALAGDFPEQPISVIRYQILREAEDGQQPVPADRATVLQPLDVLEVILETPETLPDSIKGG